MYRQSVLPPDLQHQQPLQTVSHRLQSSMRKLLHSQASTRRHPRSLVQADEGQKRPVRGYSGAAEFWKEMGANPWVTALESVSGREHCLLQMGQVSEEAAPYGGQLGAGFSQESAHSLEGGSGAEVWTLLKLELLKLHSLWSSTVSLPANHTNQTAAGSLGFDQLFVTQIRAVSTPTPGLT